MGEHSETPEEGDAAASRGHGFGTAPVFLAGISTILGAVMFLRFGYAVGHAGPLGAVAIIVIGHLVTIPTALALSEIATNRRVEGGGEYFIISRSFGLRIGGAIGVALYLSQAISVAFYCIAFAEAVRPLAPYLLAATGVAFDARMVSVPLAVGLVALMLTKGAAMGVRALYVVFAILALSVVLFFAGSPMERADGELDWFARVQSPDGFFLTFAIVFPAFTGMTQGVGLSGDLAKPRVSIPLGTIAATVIGMLVYLALVWKFATSAPVEVLANDQLVMSRIAVWGPIIPIGLACATLSSAIGSLLVAPRTLQALARDRLFYPGAANRALGTGVGEEDEPRVATVATAVVVIAVVGLGDVDFVARIISMFFMVTYGALCTISFLEHFGGNPSYRPTFRTKWWLSAIGAGMCLFLMFQMDPVYAIASLCAMGAFYWLTRFTPGGDTDQNLISLFRAVMAQLTRRLHIQLQRGQAQNREPSDWRPSIVTLRPDTFTGSHDPIRLMGWLCSRHGFGTYLHYIEGRLDAETHQQSAKIRPRLVELCGQESPGVFVETMVSPSRRTAMAQAMQVPGVTGTDTNTVLFDFARDADDATIVATLSEVEFAMVTGKSVLVLRHTDRGFAERESIHVWVTDHAGPNVALMMLIAFILVGHRDWRHADVVLFVTVRPDSTPEANAEIVDELTEGRMPVRRQNIRFIGVEEGALEARVEAKSASADLVILAMSPGALEDAEPSALRSHPGLGNVLFVQATQRIDLA